MAHLIDFLSTLTFIWGYMFIYNITLMLFFYTLFQFLNSKNNTMSSLGSLGSDNSLTKFLLVSIFSMAGVPPFWGFFQKLFIFNLLNNSNFAILFIFFLIFVFLGLYFYIQNVRFLNSTNPSKYNFISDSNLRILPIFFCFASFITFLLLCGVMYTGDFLVLIKWIFM